MFLFLFSDTIYIDTFNPQKTKVLLEEGGSSPKRRPKSLKTADFLQPHEVGTIIITHILQMKKFKFREVK